MPTSLFDKQKKAILLRKQGMSLSEIAYILQVAKSSASLWVRNVSLSKRAQKRIQNIISVGQKKAVQVMVQRRRQYKLGLEQVIKTSLSTMQLDPFIKRLICSIFYWTEGSKNPQTRVSFTNSDPKMIQTYLFLLRSAFKLDETKFRALVHIHTYHDDNDIKRYWSLITRIPLSQFHNSFHKQSIHKRKRKDYKGTICVTYYNSQIALELRLLYNIFAKCIRGVVQR